MTEGKIMICKSLILSPSRGPFVIYQLCTILLVPTTQIEPFLIDDPSTVDYPVLKYVPAKGLTYTSGPWCIWRW